MSLLNCTVACTADPVTSRYDLAACEDVLRAYGFEGVILFHCSLTFTDISSSAEWDTHIAAGLILKLPCGAMNFGDPTEEIAAEDGCGRQIVDFSEVPFTFETVQVAADRSDEQWWYDLDKKWYQYTIGWMSCDGYLYLGDAATSEVIDDSVVIIGYSPGFEATKTSRPRWTVGNGNGKAGKWVAEGFYRTKSVHRGIDVPGLVASLIVA